MSHRSFAAIWTQLEGRPDIANIVREQIGEHILDSSDAPNLDRPLTSSLPLIALFKVIFDLQRTYYQCSTAQVESAHLLPTRLLRLAIIYLLRIKCKALRSASTLYAAQRSFLARVLISGLRALWLALGFHRCHLPDESVKELSIAFDQAWKGEELVELDELDRFLIRIQHIIISAELSRPTSDLSIPARGKVRLPNHSTGLYPLESRPDELLAPVRDATASFDFLSDWSLSYWTLFDITWTTEAALIQLVVHSSNVSGKGKSAAPTPDDIKQVCTTREKVLHTIFQSGNIPTVAKSSIAAILLAPWCENTCSCLERADSPLDYSGSESAKFPSLGVSSPERPHLELDQCLNELARTLESRKEGLRDCNGDMKSLSDNFDDCMNAWYSETSSIRLASSSSRRARRFAYIFQCPKLHPIPYDILRGLIIEDDKRTGITDLENNSPFFKVDITCSQCEIPYPVVWVRRIEPLGHLSAMMTDKLRKQPTRQESFQPGINNGDPLRANSSGNSSSRTNTNSTSLSKKEPSRHGKLSEVFGETDKKPFYSFSADGQCVILWMKKGSYVVLYDIDSNKFEERPAKDVSLAAQGAKVYAYAYFSDNEHHLHARWRRDGQELFSRSISEPVCGIAVSRNDKFVAVVGTGSVYVYELGNGALHHHSLPPLIPPNRLDSQRIDFSADCEEVLVATRGSERGVVQVYDNKCTSPNTSHSVFSIEVPRESGNDFGLSSVLCVNPSSICITAFTRKTPPVLFSRLSPGDRPATVGTSYDPHLGTQIQCAAHSPSGQKLVLVNNENEVFSGQQRQDARWHFDKIGHLRSLKKPVKREDWMAVGMPDEQTIHLFWVKRGNEWGLKTI